MTRTPKLLLKRFAFLVFGGGTLLYFLVWHRSATTVTNVRAACLWQHVSFNEPLNPKAGTPSAEITRVPNEDKLHLRSPVNETTSIGEVEEELFRAATVIAERRGVVLFSVLNDAYFDLAASWLCNTAPLGDVHRHVLFLTTDVATGQRLEDAWPDISVVSMNDSSFSGAQEYSKAGYVHLMVQRTRLVLRLVETGIRVLLFEVDFVWLGDPLPAVLSHSRLSQADVVATGIHGQPRLVCGCFLLLNPTPATTRLWARLTERMEGLNEQIAGRSALAPVSEGTNDQTFLSALIRERYGGVRVAVLPEALFPDGKWYDLPHLRAATPAALVIHNNWIIGNAAKIRRARAFGHWFLGANSTESKVVCNVTAVRDLLERRHRDLLSRGAQTP